MITTEQETAIRDMLASMQELAVGLGTKERACSLGALNLALTGTLTDTVPKCMSVVIGRWVISVQDRMPAADRDSAAWRGLLVLAAGTGRAHEPARLAIVMDWMWDALATLQSHADAHGFGDAWATMLRERTPLSARTAVADADADAAAAAAAVADADADADAAAVAYAVSDAAAVAAAYAYAAADADADAAAVAAADAAAVAAAAADAAAYAVSAAHAAAVAYAVSAAYARATLDQVSLLRRLVAVTDDRALTVPS